MEQILKESEEKYKNLVENFPYSIVLLKLDGVIINSNSATEKLFGYSEDDLIGKNFLKLPIFLPETLFKLTEQYKILIKENSIEPLELQVYDKDGKLIWIYSQVSLIELGGENYFQVITQDINENKVAERKLKESEEKVRILNKELEQRVKERTQALKESEKKYRHLFEDSPFSIILGNMQGKILECNSTVFKTFGYKKDELIEKDFREFPIFSPEALKIALNDFKLLLKGDTPEPRDFQIYKKDGNQIWVNSKASIIELKNQKLIQIIIQDITEKKEAEQTIRDKKNALESLLRAAPVGIGLVVNRVLIEINDKFCELIGYTREELIGKNARMVYPSDEDYEYVGREKYGQIEKYGIGTVETRFKRKDGKILDILLSSALIDQKNPSLGATFTALDITEIKKSEQALKESEEKYRLISENANDLISVLNNKFEFEYINELPLLKILGYSPEELIGKKGTKFTHPDDLEKVLKEFRKGVEVGEGSVEARLKHKAGNYIWTETKGRWFIDKNGKQKGLIITRDITERKEALKKLQESEEKYRLISENANDLIFILNQNFEFEYINEPVFRKILGYSNKDLIGESGLKIIHPEDINKAMNEIREIFRIGEGTIQFRVKDKKGTYHWLEFKGKLFLDQYGFKRGLLIARDITSREKIRQYISRDDFS